MKTKRRQILILSLILFSVVSIVASLNKTIRLPWETKVTANNPIAVKTTDDKTVILEGNMQNITVLNQNNEVENIIEFGILDSNDYYWPSILYNKAYYYFVIDEYYLNSAFLSSEKIVRTADWGKTNETVLKLKYDLDSQRILQPRILCAFERKGQCFAAVVNSQGNAYAVINISDGSNKELEYQDILFDKMIDSEKLISMIWYDQDSEKLYAMDQFGQAYFWELNISGKGMVTDYFESDDYYRALYASSANISSVENAETSKTADFSDDRYHYLKHQPAEISAVEGKSFPINTLSQIRIWLFWLGVLILTFLVVLRFIRIIHKLRTKGNFATLKRIALMTAIGLSCLMIVLFYSYHIISASYDSAASIQKVLAQTAHRQTSSLADQAKSEFDGNGQVSPETYNKIETIFEDTAFISANEGFGTGFVFCLMKDNRYYPIIYTPKVILSASMNKGLSEIPEPKEKEVLSSSNSATLGYYGYSRVVYTNHSGEPIGMIYAVNNYTEITSNFLKTCADLFLKLFVGALVMIYAVMEMTAWVRGFRKRSVLQKEGMSFQGIALSRPLGFLAIAINAADSALIVLIVKDMLVGTPYEGNLLICSLPMAVMGLGFLFGEIAGHHFFSKFDAKKTLLIGTVIIIAILIIEATSVYLKNVPLLLLAMFILTICTQSILFYAVGYASFAPDDDLRRECNLGLSACKISAYALITILTGYACTKFGNYTVYLVALVPAGILFAMVLFNSFENRNTTVEKSGVSKIGFKVRMRFLKTPEMIILIVCGIIASEILSGYKSYVFPLFADQGGISKSTISNIHVLAQAIVFFTLPLINQYQKRVGEKKVIIIDNIVLAGIFFMFLLNKSVIWAIVALIASYISTRDMDTSINFIWQKYAIDKNFDLGIAQSVIGNTRQIINILKAPFLGWLLGFGQLLSCIIIGTYLGVSAFVFKINETLPRRKK